MSLSGAFNKLVFAAGIFISIPLAPGTRQERNAASAEVDIELLTKIVLHQESGGNRYDRYGRVVTSRVGAKGEMQVMDATNRDPGFGVRPARNNSLDERARVGRDYLRALVKHYGNAEYALAAYNCGPGNFDDALEQAKDDGKLHTWLSYTPQETQNYVRNARAKLLNASSVAIMTSRYSKRVDL